MAAGKSPNCPVQFCVRVLIVLDWKIIDDSDVLADKLVKGSAERADNDSGTSRCCEGLGISEISRHWSGGFYLPSILLYETEHRRRRQLRVIPKSRCAEECRLGTDRKPEKSGCSFLVRSFEVESVEDWALHREIRLVNIRDDERLPDRLLDMYISSFFRL
ncbi:hypothetical protein N7504_002091 [Penicillium tannophilum]|nr:hypothetical protein N7504_002091 [Penicillium tannophilum]